MNIPSGLGLPGLCSQVASGDPRYDRLEHQSINSAEAQSVPDRPIRRVEINGILKNWQKRTTVLFSNNVRRRSKNPFLSKHSFMLSIDQSLFSLHYGAGSFVSPLYKRQTVILQSLKRRLKTLWLLPQVKERVANCLATETLLSYRTCAYLRHVAETLSTS